MLFIVVNVNNFRYISLIFLSDNISSIVDKDNLYFNMKKQFSKECDTVMAETEYLTYKYKYNSRDILVARPINEILKNGIKHKAGKGKDIVFMYNYDCKK